MRHFKLQFIRKFYLASALLTLAALAIVWIYTDTVRWLEHDVEQSILTDNVLSEYQELFKLVSSQLRAMSESVLQGDARPLFELGPGASVLREAASIVRQDIAEGVALPGRDDASAALEQVREIERLVEEVIQTSQLIGQALNEGRTEDAHIALEQFKNSGFVDSFSTLIVAAMADQTFIPSKKYSQSTGLMYNIIPKSAPILMAALVVILFLINFVLSRRTIHSIGALYKGAQAFSSGDLSHRIPKLIDKEFQRLASTFNAMAIRLSEQREQLRDTNIQLETMVDERTRQLQEINRKLANVDRNRRELLANISHEFRTPLTVIRGEADIALRGSNKTLEDHRESFRRIITQTMNATRLVDDLLFIARADAGEPRLKVSSVVIAAVIDSVCQEFTAKAKSMRVKIEQSGMAARAVVQGDHGRLRQVFTILLDNAIKYSNPGGRIEIKVLQQKGAVEVIFRDEGIGLDEEESELAFKRFYRAPKAIEKAAGTGLGLPVAKAIIEAHNGTIVLSGEPGQGSTATVVLPFGREFGVVT